MQEKKSILNYENLPETITPYDYADWRGIGENKAREIFNRPDFPRIKGRAVLLYDLGLDEKDKQEILQEIAKQII